MRFILLITQILVGPVNCLVAQHKIAIPKAEDLPKHSYVLQNQDAIALVQEKERFLELTTPVKNDLIADLDKYKDTGVLHPLPCET